MVEIVHTSLKRRKLRTAIIDGREYNVIVHRMTKRKQEFVLTPVDLTFDWKRSDDFYYLYRDGKLYSVWSRGSTPNEVLGSNRIFQVLKEQGFLKKFFKIQEENKNELERYKI